MAAVVVLEGGRRSPRCLGGVGADEVQEANDSFQMSEGTPLLCFNTESRNLIKGADSIKESLAYHSYAN